VGVFIPEQAGVRLDEEKHDVDDYEKAQRLCISRAAAVKEFV
jgi:hypothetical protein